MFLHIEVYAKKKNSHLLGNNKDRPTFKLRFECHYTICGIISTGLFHIKLSTYVSL